MTRYFKVIVAGTRDFNDYKLVKETLDFYLQNKTYIEIVSGGATGADALGERWGKENADKISIYPAKWKTHGKAAGIIRNNMMAENADALIAFWDGESSGTKHMISAAKKMGLKVAIKVYDRRGN